MYLFELKTSAIASKRALAPLKLTIILLTTLVKPTHSVSQTARAFIDWQKCFGWNETRGDIGVKTLKTADGNLLILGKKTISDRETYWLSKLTKSGDIIWETCIFNAGISNAYLPKDLIQNSLGEIYITGTSMGTDEINYSNYKGLTKKLVSSKGYYDIFVVKLTQNGDRMWEKVFGGNGADFPAKLILNQSDKQLFVVSFSESQDGDLVGSSKNTTTYNSDVFVMKLDSSGSMLGKKCFGGAGNEIVKDAMKTKNGKLIIVGSSTSTDVVANNGDKDAYVLTIDENLALINQKTFGGSKTDEIASVIETTNGNFVLGINSSSVNNDFPITLNTTFQDNNTTNIWLFKLNQQLNVLQKKYFGGTYNDEIGQIIEAKDKSLLLVGNTFSNNGDVTDRNRIPINNSIYLSDVFVLETDSTLNKNWAFTYGGQFSETAANVLEYFDHEYFLTCTTESSNGDVSRNFVDNNQTKDIWLVNLKLPCTADLLLNQNLVNTVTSFKTKNKISTLDKINPISKVDYQAGKQIQLLPGFYVNSGSTMSASITPCSDSSTAVNPNPIQIKIRNECREGGMKFVFQPFTPDTTINNFKYSVQTLDPSVPFNVTANQFVGNNNGSLSNKNIYFIVTVSKPGYADFTFQGYSGTCDHDGNPLNCPENTHDLILNKQYYAVGDIVTATWTGGLGENTGMAWYNDNITTLESTSTYFKGRVDNFPAKIQAQPSYPNYPKPCHGGVYVLLRKQN